MRRGLAAAAAIALLNASLSFQNVWPTPAIRWAGELSIECAVFLLILLAAHRRFGGPSRAVVRWLAAAWVVLVLGHYADVTTPALYGRDINLYWDVRYMPDVAAMIAHAAPLWLIVVVCLAVAVVLGLLYSLFRWAFDRVADALAEPRGRLAIGAVASAVLLLFIATGLHALGEVEPVFATPVTQTYARQARLVAGALGASRTLAPSPSMRADLALVKDTDVFLVFIESYGAIAFERTP